MRVPLIIVFMLLWGSLQANAQNLTKAKIAAIDTIVRKYGSTSATVLNEYVENVWNKDKKNAELAVGIAKAYYHYYKAKPNSTYWSFLTSDSVNAYKYINRAIEAAPKYVPAYIRGGDMQKVMNDTVKALEWYNRGIKAVPSSPDCYIAYATCLLEQHDTVGSINKLREINSIVPDYPANLAMARICENVYAQWKDAQQPFDGGYKKWSDFQKSLYAMSDIQKFDSTDYFSYAFLLYSDGEYEKAYNLSKTGMEIYPNNINVLKVALYSSTQANKYDEAISLADRLFSISDTIRYHNLDYENAAMAYRQKNNIKKAADMYHRAYGLWEENMRNEVPGTKTATGNIYMRELINMYSEAGLYDDAIAENLKWIEQGRKAGKMTVFHFNTLAKLYCDFALESVGDKKTALLQKADGAFRQVAEISDENKMYAYFQRWKIAISELDSIMNTNKAYEYSVELTKTFESLDEAGQTDEANMAIYQQACNYLRSYYIQTGEHNGRYYKSAIDKAKSYCQKILKVNPSDEKSLKLLQIFKTMKFIWR